jgi:ribosome-binding protein aMBF1 (putative translation factor)
MVNLDSAEAGAMAPRGMIEITSAQCRAARAFLRWSAQELADRARVGVTTVRRFEIEAAVPVTSTTASLRRAFEDAGIEFVGDYGVLYRPKKRSAEG